MTEFDVTVVIPCHNDADYITEAVESVWNQQGANVGEVVIVSDRSDERTQAVLEQLACDGKVRVIENRGPPGPAAARNTGWRASSSKWIAFLDADDLFTPGSIIRRMEALQECNADWVGGEFEIWWPAGEASDELFFANRPAARGLLAEAYATGKPQVYRRPTAVFLETSISHLCSTIIARHLLEQLGGFDERYLWVEDYLFFLRLSTIADFVFVPDPLFRYRQHSGSTTGGIVPWSPKYWHIRAFHELSKELTFRHHRHTIGRRLADFYRENCDHYRLCGKRVRAIASSVSACRSEPLNTINWRYLAAAMLGPVEKP